MVWRMILVIAEVLVFLWSMKSGFWLSMLQNVPYIGVVADILCNYLGFTGSGMNFPSTQPFSEEFVKALIFTCSYALLEPPVRGLCRIVIGKHSYHRDLKEAVDRMFLALISSVLCAMVTSLFMEYVYLAAINWAAGFIPWLKYAISFASLSVVLLIGFFIFGQTALLFFLWILTKFIIPTVLKVLSVEFMVVLLYLLLNIPNMMENMATLVILCIGICCCLGAIFGVSLYDRRIDDYWSPGRHG